MTADVEVWLYGSRARGDADALSDTDILAVASHGDAIPAATAGLQFPRINMSFYSWDEVEAMHAYGSLYLHHLAQEGQRLRANLLAPDRLPSLLANLPPFTRAKHDLRGFRFALEESIASLEDGGWPDFECEVVATVARHAAILGAYCVGAPAFGRERPFQVIGAALRYATEDVVALAEPATAWRKHRPGPHEAPAATRDWLARVSHFLDDLEQVINDHAAVLPYAA